MVTRFQAGFVRLIVERPGEFQGKRIDMASDSLTGLEMGKVLALARGRDIEYAQASLGELRSRSTDHARMWEWFEQVATASTSTDWCAPARRRSGRTGESLAATSEQPRP